MIIVDPVTLGDTSYSGGGGTYWDRNGVLQDAVTNVLRVTYDPVDLSKAPYALVEAGATNVVRNSTAAGGSAGVLPTFWQVSASAVGLTITSVGIGVEDGVHYADIRISGTVTVAGTASIFPDGFNYPTVAASGQTYTCSFFQRLVGGSNTNIAAHFTVLEEYDSTNGYVAGLGYSRVAPTSAGLRLQRQLTTRTLSGGAATARVGFYVAFSFNVGAVVDITIRIGLPQLVQGTSALFPMRSSSGTVTRAADVIGSTAGLVYSNVAIAEANYNPATTYSIGQKVYDPTTHKVYESVANTNLGNALTNTAKWIDDGATNRWAMLDQYNNTQTSNADEILVVVSTKVISQGMYLGNLDGNDIRVSVVDLTEGLTYRETQSQIVSDTASSFFNWLFKRIRRKTYAVSVMLPVYANALVTIAIRKDGGTAKCGMAVVGPVIDVGLSQYGLSTEIKDYSTTRFNFDGTSETTVRGYSKRMAIDLMLSNDVIDSVQEQLAAFRQKPVAYLGATMYGSTCLFGKFSTMKNVIKYDAYSQMSMQIEGTV